MHGGGSENSWGARRKSSYRRSLRSNRLGSYGGPSLSPVPSEDVGGENNENMGYDPLTPLPPCQPISDLSLGVPRT